MAAPARTTPLPRERRDTASAAAVLPAAESTRPSLGRRVRELADELILVFVIVMFVKLFIVELYKIPTGSMTPTLLGGKVAWVDADQDGSKDLVYLERPENPRNPQPLLFVRQGDRYVANPDPPPLDAVKLWEAQGLFKFQSDRILVNKMAYWFRAPHRGEIVVFKVPRAIYRPEAPIYIKRCIGEPGDVVTFAPDGTLQIDGKPVREPEFFRTQRYRTVIGRTELLPQPEVRYVDVAANLVRIERIDVPPDRVYVFGDNTEGSLDSRYWGGVPLEHFKGRAFMRLWPVTQFAFLK